MKIHTFLLALAALLLVTCGPNRSRDDQSQETNMPMMQEGQEGQRGGMGPMHRGGTEEGEWNNEDMRRAMMSGEMGPGMMGDMRTIHTLFANHESIGRRVEDLPNGIRAWTESDDPDIAQAIQTHVRDMKERMENKQPIRQRDPLFRELFEHADAINLTIENTEKGVVVTETSEDPQAVKLIRQHAHEAVSNFVDEGMSHAMQPLPLPEGYQE